MTVQSYQQTFSPNDLSQSILSYQFPLEKRAPAEPCDGKAPYLQKGARCAVLYQGDFIPNADAIPEDDFNALKTGEGIVALNKKGISLAIDKRVALFFQQAILCYKMSDFVFSAKGADAQIGTSPTKTLKCITDETIKIKREAAHSSTIPTLIAHAKNGSTPDGFVYLKGGSGYYQHNATIGMHECVNGADELIDGNGRDGKLREISIRILNRVADGLDPVAATKEFCEAFKNTVAQNSVHLLEEDSRRHVLNSYFEKIEKIQRTALINSANFDHLIGVIIDQSNPLESTLRKVIYQKRYDVIKLQEVVESRIAKIMDVAKKEMGVKSQLEYMLLKKFSFGSEKKVLERLLGKTTAYFEAEFPAETKNHGKFKAKITNLTDKHEIRLQALMRDMRACFRELSAAEFSYRAGVFRDLRTKVHDWTQKQFCSEYFKVNGSFVSPSWVSRTEQLSRLEVQRDYITPIDQRRRYITVAEGIRCAKAFDVDAGLFLPSLFTSKD